MYAYSGPENGGDATGSDLGNVSISRKQLEMSDTLSEGRFAIIRKAHLQTGNETITVAAKSLRSNSLL